MLNQIYSDVLGKPVLVPDGTPTSLGSGIFAFLAANAFRSIEEAQARMCLPFVTYVPSEREHSVYNRLFVLYQRVYLSLGTADGPPASLGDVLPELRKIAAEGATWRR